MATVGFIGSGNIGGAVARLAVAAGYDVVLSNSRGPQTLEGLVEEIGTARAGGYPDRGRGSGRSNRGERPTEGPVGGACAAAGGQACPRREQLHPQRDGRIPGLYDGPSSSEVLQQDLPTAHVVKVFNNITSWHLRSLARPAGAADRSALPIAGDDPAAKAAVTRFLDAIGYDTDRGADTMDIGVGELDLAARRLYESLGFTNRRGGADGPLMHVYERDLRN